MSLLFTILFPSSSVVTIGFDAAAYNVTETDGSVSVGVSVQGSTTLARDVVVTVQTMGGTATGGTLMYVHTLCRCVVHVYHFLPPATDDYTSVSMTLVFNSGTITHNVMITIVDDTTVEDTESFTVSLTTGDRAVTLAPESTTVNIQDENDSKFLCEGTLE